MIRTKLIKLLQILPYLCQDPGVIFHRGFSLSSFRLAVGISHHCHSFGTILDIGANVGQFALAASHRFPGTKIISFEPVPDIVVILKKNVKNYHNIVVIDKALGSIEGERDFYQNAYSPASSGLKVSDTQKKFLNTTGYTKTINVHVQRLDRIAAHLDIFPPILLKLDVQGLEKDVLLGAGDFLNKVEFILIETSFVQMYENEPLFEEIHDLLQKRGYRLF
jgi:FkbM family methyltransferase